MFYSETLLQKSGPLARVWLSANLERKLSKNHILQSNVTDSVEAIITPNQAPMALRLSGQLLLGVVRIYQRKTRYLLDDCNEAMMKIKMVSTCASSLSRAKYTNKFVRLSDPVETMIWLATYKYPTANRCSFQTVSRLMITSTYHRLQMPHGYCRKSMT